MTPHREAFPSAAQRRLLAALRHEDMSTHALRTVLNWNGPSTYGHLCRLEALGCVQRYPVGARLKWHYIGLPEATTLPTAPKPSQRVAPPYRSEFRPLNLDLFQHARLAMMQRAKP